MKTLDQMTTDEFYGWIQDYYSTGEEITEEEYNKWLTAGYPILSEGFSFTSTIGGS